MNIAVVGAGYFAGLHHKAWARLPDCVLVGIADPNPDAQSPDDVSRFHSLADMVSSTDIDVLDIVVPPSAHKMLIETAIASGINRIICQKPFCASFAEAQEMAELAKQHHVSLVIHDNFRFQPWYRAIKEQMATDRFGQIYQFRFALRPGDGQGKDAYLARQPYFQIMPRFLVHETAIHFLDVFAYLFGAPQAVYADLRRLNPVIKGEDAGLIVLDYPDGLRVVFDGNRLVDHNAENHRLTMGEAELEAEKGTLRLAGDGALYWRAHGSQIIEQLTPVDSTGEFGGDCVYHLISHAINAWQNNLVPENEIEEYLAVMALEEAVYNSAQSGIKQAL
ncbi:MAG: Gfo/Idh/MocA family protein [Candidatus Puniceispirillaceae bacterium]